METPQKSNSNNNFNTPPTGPALYFEEFIVPAPLQADLIKKKAPSSSSSSSSLNHNNNNNKSKLLSSSSSSLGEDFKVKVPWTQEEDDILTKAVEQYKGRGWKQVAELLPGRTHSQAAHRWQKVLDPKLKKGSWTVDEDLQLQKAVEEIGQGHWSKVAEKVATRNGKQCRERWRNQISPEVDKRPWDPAEDEKITQLFHQLGPKWAEIAKHFQGRTENAVKNRWNAKLGRPQNITSPSNGTTNNTPSSSARKKSKINSNTSTPRTTPKMVSNTPNKSEMEESPSYQDSKSPTSSSLLPPRPPPRKQVKLDMDGIQALLALKGSST